MRKIKKTLLSCLIAIFAVTIGFGFATMQSKQTANATNSTCVTKDVAMLGSIAGWYGNGNFEVRLTLGEADWTNNDEGQKTFDTTNGDLPTLLNNLDFFNHIEVGGKTLAEWGCTSCYDNIYWLNNSEPDYTLMIPLAMGSENMAIATAAGVGSHSRLTIKEGALVPSYAYLKGDATATVYRAGCDFVTEDSTVAYGIMAKGKTEVEAIDYVTGWDSTYNNAYLGVSLKGDDFLGDGTQAERCGEYHSDVYTTNLFPNKITVDDVAGKAESYGLFNLGSKGQGYFSFVIRAQEEESSKITIPAGTIFPSRAMKTLYEFNGNPVFIMYETQTDVTFYKTSDGNWVKLDDYKAEMTSAIDEYRQGKLDADYFTTDVAVLDGVVTTAKTAIDSATTIAEIEGAVESAKTAMDEVATKASVINPAKEEIANYKSGLFREAEETQRSTIVATAQSSLDGATSSSAVSEIVEATKTQIDLLKTAAQYADEELADSKASAKEEISNYLDKNNYYDEQHEAIDEAIADGHDGVTDATNETEIAQAVIDAKAVLDAILTKEEVVAGFEADINGYKADEGLFRATEKAQRDSIVENAINEISVDKTYTQNSQFIADAKDAIDALKTDAEYDAEELTLAKEDAKEDLDAYKADADLYRDEEAEDRQEIINNAKTAIDSATEISAITDIVAGAKEAIDELKTDAELDAEEALATAKSNAIVEINLKKADLDFTKYSEESVEQINSLYSTAKDAIDSATTEAEITAAVNAFMTAIDAIPTIGSDEPTSEPSSNGGSGCAGSVNGVSAVMALFTLCGLVFVARKRK